MSAELSLARFFSAIQADLEPSLVNFLIITGFNLRFLILFLISFCVFEGNKYLNKLRNWDEYKKFFFSIKYNSCGY